MVNTSPMMIGGKLSNGRKSSTDNLNAFQTLCAVA